MKFNVIYYTLFAFVMVMFFPSLIYAPWSQTEPPLQPSPDVEKDCAGWIVFNGFTLRNERVNRKKAETRDHDLDKKASTWAAMYAFKIGGRENLYPILPKKFCETFDEHSIPKKFVALKDESRYCEDWITLYGFTENDQLHNFRYAKNIRLKDDERLPILPPVKTSNIGLWAYFYYIFVLKHGKKIHLTPKDFCSVMGITVGEDANLKPFSCEKDTFKTCKGWIHFYEFTDSPIYNLQKAEFVNSASLKYKLRLQYFASNYVIKLLKLKFQGLSTDLTPQDFCSVHNGDGDEPRLYDVDYKPPSSQQIELRFNELSID